MATGTLVPFEVSPGRTVMVPDYLVPQSPPAPLQLPEAGAPPPPDPNRMAANDANPFLAQASPDYRAVLDAGRAPPPASPLAMTVAPPTEDAEQRRKRQDAERAIEAAKEARAQKANPKNLKPVPKVDPRRESNVIAETAADLYKPKTGGPGKPAPVDPQNLRPVVAEIKQERTPGVRLLPEQEWRYGFSERPEFPDEIDPDADQPTWGTEEPVRRPYMTPLERGAKQAGEAAYKAGEQELMARREMGVAQRSALAQQSEALDQHLTTIAERRNRIAALQEAADARMTEAESFEPRTRNQVWDSRGGAIARIMGIIAIGLGGHRGGTNEVWKNLNQSIEDEVNEDRAKWERKRQLGIDAKSDLARAMQAYGDLDMALLETKNRKLASSLAYIKQMQGDRALDMNGQAYLAQLRAQVEEAFLENRRQVFDMAVGKVTKEEATLKPYGQVLQSATPKPVGGGSGGGAAPGISGDKLKGLSAEIRSLAVKLPDGTYKFARSAEEKKDLQNKMVTAGTMINRLRQLQALRADGANTIKWTEKRGQIGAIGADLLRLGKSKDAMGTLDKGLIEFSQRQFGSPEEFHVVDAETDGKIKENIRMLQEEVRKASEYYLDNGPFELTEGGVSPDEVRD